MKMDANRIIGMKARPIDGGGWLWNVCLALCVVAVATWAYWGSLASPWLFDDHQVLEQATVQGSRALAEGEGLWDWVWRSPRPLRQLSFWADTRIWGAGKALQLAVRTENLILHAGVAVLFGLLLRRLGRRRAVAWGAAALFAVLPVHWETLGIASHRKELLAAFFGLLGVAGTLEKGWWRRGLGLACFALAAMGKETAVSFTALAAMLGWWSGRPASDGNASRGLNLWPWAALGTGLALGVLAWAQTRWSMDRLLLSWDGDMGLGAGAGTWGAGLMTAVRSFPRYLAMMAGWKTPCLDRGLAAAAGWRGAADTGVSALFCAAWAWGTWRGWSTGRGWGAAMAWVTLALGVVLVPPLLEGRQVAVLAGRYAYAASLGFAWLVAEAVGLWRGRWAVAVLAVLTVGAGVATRSHAREFESEKALWTSVLRWNPGSRLACHNLVQAMRQDGDQWGAVKFLSEHIRKLGRSPFAQVRADGPTVVAVAGDSVPFGWNDEAPDQSLPLSARLARRAAAAGESDRWTFSNWAVPGSTLMELPGVLRKRLRENHADRCIVMSGHNDALQGTSVQNMLRAAADVAADCFMGGAEPLLVGPVPVQSTGERNRTAQAATLAAFSRRLAALCAENGVRYLDYAGFATARSVPGAEWNSGESGVHLSFAGMENLAGFVFYEGLKAQGLEGQAAAAATTENGPNVHNPDRVRFALCQLDSRKGDIPGNVRQALVIAEAAADQGADVVVFPEYSFLSIHDLLGNEIPDLGGMSWGLPVLSEFASRRGCWLIANHPRLFSGSLHNESFVVAPDGSVASAYRKCVLALADQQVGMKPGGKPAPIELPFATIGILICKDASFPNRFMKAYNQTDLLLLQFAHVRGNDPQESLKGPFARYPDTLEDIVANCCSAFGKTQLLVDKTGKEPPWRLEGGTCVVTPAGQIRADAGEKVGILFVDFPLHPDGHLDASSPQPFFWTLPTQE